MPGERVASAGAGLSQPAAAARIIGVAIDIPEPYAGELRAWRKRVGDPQAEAVPPHVTLLPPTKIAERDLPAVEDHLAAVAARHAPFEMRLGGTGTFCPVSEVVFVQVSMGIAECELLERDIRSGPPYREIAFPYHPHVTVAHDVPRAQLAAAFEGLEAYRARFGVTTFTMFEQGRDGVWQPRRDFALGGQAERG